MNPSASTPNGDHQEFLYEFLNAAYDRETERHGRLFERVSLVSGFLVLLGTGITTLHAAYALEFDQTPWLDGIFLGTLTGALVYFGLAVVFILKSSAKVYLFANAGDPLIMWNEYQVWVAYADNPAVITKPDLKAKFQKAISEQFAKAASHNRTVSELRNQLLQRAIKAGLISGVILIASTLCFVIKKYADPKEGPVRVEIINPIKIK